MLIDELGQKRLIVGSPGEAVGAADLRIWLSRIDCRVMQLGEKARHEQPHASAVAGAAAYVVNSLPDRRVGDHSLLDVPGGLIMDCLQNVLGSLVLRCHLYQRSLSWPTGL